MMRRRDDVSCAAEPLPRFTFSAPTTTISPAMLFHLFDIFRWLVFVFVTVYFLVTSGQLLWSYWVWLSAPDRYTGMLRNYIIVQGLRTKVTRFWPDLIICGLLCFAFVLMWRAHLIIGQIARTVNDVR
jgi:hypothetical protein